MLFFLFHIFSLIFCHSDFGLADVRRVLAEQEVAEGFDEDALSLGVDMSEAAFILQGLQLEEQQYVHIYTFVFLEVTELG